MLDTVTIFRMTILCLTSCIVSTKAMDHFHGNPSMQKVDTSDIVYKPIPRRTYDASTKAMLLPDALATGSEVKITEPKALSNKSVKIDYSEDPKTTKKRRLEDKPNFIGGKLIETNAFSTILEQSSESPTHPLLKDWQPSSVDKLTVKVSATNNNSTNNNSLESDSALALMELAEIPSPMQIGGSKELDSVGSAIVAEPFNNHMEILDNQGGSPWFKPQLSNQNFSISNQNNTVGFKRRPVPTTKQLNGENSADEANPARALYEEIQKKKAGPRQLLVELTKSEIKDDRDIAGKVLHAFIMEDEHWAKELLVVLATSDNWNHRDSAAKPLYSVLKIKKIWALQKVTEWAKSEKICEQNAAAKAIFDGIRHNVPWGQEKLDELANSLNANEQATATKVYDRLNGNTSQPSITQYQLNSYTATQHTLAKYQHNISGYGQKPNQWREHSHPMGNNSAGINRQYQQMRQPHSKGNGSARANQHYQPSYNYYTKF